MPYPQTPDPQFRLPVSPAAPEAAARRAAAALPAGGVLYYALGGGLGHLTRGLAIRRRFRRLRSEPFLLLTNCRAPVPEPAELLELDGEPAGPAALGALVAALVGALRPAVLAVDAFPAGILGELAPLLPGLPCRRAAVLRRLQPRWVERWALPVLVPRAYDAAVAVEEGALPFPLPPSLRQLHAPPVLVRDAGELLPRAAARAAFGPAGEGPVVCAVVTGTRPADQGLLGATARAAARASGGEAEVRLVTPYPGGLPAGRYLFHYPLLEWLPGADVVVGPCGYNLCHETAAVGVPAVFVPQPRRYDDQGARAAGRETARSPEELEARLRAHLARREGRPPPAYANGAREVAGLLADLAG